MDKTKLRNYIGRLNERISAIFFGIMAIVIFIQVINRYFIKYPIDWFEELAIYAFIWSTYLSLATVTQEDKHLEVRYIREIVGLRAKKIIIGFTYIITILFSLYVVIYGGRMVLEMAHFGETTPALEIPLAWVYASIPVGLGLMGISTLFKFKELFQFGTFDSNKRK